MAKTYYLDLTNGTHTLGKQFTHELAQALGSIQTDTITAPSGNQVDSGYYEEIEDTAITRTSTGTFSVEVNISTAVNDTRMRVIFHRVNAAGSIQASSTPTAFQATTSTGLLNFSDSSVGLGTWLSDDRLTVELEVNNEAPHGGDKGPTHDLETVNAEVQTPFTDPAVGGSPVPYYNMMRRS